MGAGCVASGPGHRQGHQGADRRTNEAVDESRAARDREGRPRCAEALIGRVPGAAKTGDTMSVAGKGLLQGCLTPEDMAGVAAEGLARLDVDGRRVLVL